MRRVGFVESSKQPWSPGNEPMVAGQHTPQLLPTIYLAEHNMLLILIMEYIAICTFVYTCLVNRSGSRYIQFSSSVRNVVS